MKIFAMLLLAWSTWQPPAPSQGAEVRTQAEWTGSTLLVTSIVDAVGVTFKDQMTLSPDGATLTSLVRIALPQGEVDLRVVFDKQ
jgi:hypothetical protein